MVVLNVTNGCNDMEYLEGQAPAPEPIVYK